MTSIKPKNILNIRSMYQDIQPDPWAVTRMKARLQQEKKVTLDDLVSQIFRKYVLVASLVLLVLTLVLDSRLTTLDEPQDEIATWLFGESTNETLITDIPEYTFLTEIQD
ncbi:MAG TPA: hypothetical protein DCE78_07080 [Bacteroidetes bacterium]|nr:hypothetical protein [Bacteroidota bacterium]